MSIPKRPLLILLLLIAASLLSVLLKPEDKRADRLNSINLAEAVPEAFGDWKLDKSLVPVDPSAVQGKTIAKTYDQLISHSYVNSQGQRVMLALAYGSAQKQGLRAHRQEVCYAAQGFHIRDLKKINAMVDGKNLIMTRMVAVHGSRVEPVSYWLTMGSEVVSSPYSKFVVQLRYAFSGLIPDGYLFRVSTIDPDVAHGFETQEKFTEAFIRAVPPELKNRLLGMTTDGE